MVLTFTLLSLAATACLVCSLLDLLAQRRNRAMPNRRLIVCHQRRLAERQLRRTTQAGLDALFAEAFPDRPKRESL